MFSLIISIISIALVAALAVATIYFGGSQLTQGTAKARAAQLINAGQQVNGAFAVAANDGAARGTVAQLVSGNYLAAAPQVPSPAAAVDALTNLGTGVSAGNEVGYAVTTVDANVCNEVNGRATGTVGTMDNVAADSQQFGCVGNTFFFKM